MRRNIMGDILKEAIADAKAVRETALQNAKMALEEAFTPQLKSMLSAKLKEDEMGDEEEPEETYEDEEVGEEEPEEGYHEDDEEPEVPAEEGYYEDEEVGEEEPEEGMHDEGEEDEEELDDNLDLEAVIRELESELSEQDDAYDDKVGKTDASHLAEEDDAYDTDVEVKKDPKHVGGTIGEGEDEEDDTVEEEYEITLEGEEDDDEDKVDEQSKSSEIGSGDNKVHYASSSDEEDPGNSTDVEKIGEQLREYKEAVKFLKDKLHEVNILNAKLLFTNKLFKSYSLNNNQKLKVVETFDRAQSTREIKLVYTTLAEQFGDNSSITRKHSIKESASSKAGSTKPSQSSRKVITEESKVANRFKKLAGLL